MFIEIQDKEYQLATTLRVAYKVQGQHGHKPYAEVFQKLGDMTLEQQVDIVYASFSTANPEEAKTITGKVFLENFLDKYNVGQLMSMLEGIIEGIMGPELIEKAKEKNKPETETETEQGN